MIALKGVVFVDFVVECPFCVEKIFPGEEGLEATFGQEGAHYLRNANTLYAINLKGKQSVLLTKVQWVFSKAIAKSVSGEIYLCDEGKFLA